MALLYRSSSILRAVNSLAGFGASYRVTAYEAGAVASAASSGTTVTVYSGHGFTAGDKALISPGSGNVFTAAIDSVTATTLVFASETYTIAAGDLLINLGPDTGSSAPNYDGSPVSIYSVPSGSGSDVANATVTANSVGDYQYWHAGAVTIWELVRDGDGTVVGYDITSESSGASAATIYTTATMPDPDDVGAPAIIIVKDPDQPALVKVRVPSIDETSFFYEDLYIAIGG